jgi:RNA polymerase sigma-70 factor (ECF subfamily)
MASIRTDQVASLRPRLLAYALQRTRSRDQAEDAVQEALLAALEGLDSYAGQSSLATWLFGILKHKIVDGVRRAPREQGLEGDLDELVHPGPGPYEACASRSALAALDRGLGRLSFTTARAFVLREVLGTDTPEVCRELHITPGHCWVLVHRARKHLRLVPETA